MITTWLIFPVTGDRTESYIQTNTKPIPGEGGCPEDTVPQIMPLSTGDMRIGNYKKAVSGEIADYDPL